ncbi:hypothetical protein GCM10023115_02470 [Pontixanthobacter gangjinensis]|uniref:Cyclic nucleotide-binding domain-containing protein n=1 Tax=Pontixanthobacter gangjinensis TaxID=1028742 RepID=A0A6I4SK47_9SPHN|nr:Crp/Fnr family transcriptional regulator [Pontixanthobacter gangjinensis]MXO55500.1 cyclic nucleotide-binding domain-containing protein [Pontixanthobacter gangjinensis]
MSNSIHFDPNLRYRSLLAPTLFGELAPAMQIDLLAKAPLLQFTDGQIIQHRGDKPNGFWVIEQGAVKVGQFRLKGELRVIALLGQGDSYGELALFAANERAVDSVADGDVKLRWIEGQSFEQAIATDLPAMRRLIGALAKQLQETVSLVSSLGEGTSKARIAAVLINLAGGGPLPAIVRLGQEELAELTGLTRATVNKCLGQMELEGALVRRYGRLEIIDAKILKDAASG